MQSTRVTQLNKTYKQGTHVYWSWTNSKIPMGILYAVRLNLRRTLSPIKTRKKTLSEYPQMPLLHASSAVMVGVTLPSIFNLLESMTAMRPSAAHFSKGLYKEGLAWLEFNLSVLKLRE